ncbi:hypothetical protein CT0861_12270 [Colletotrichum tofieldiae]|uniref:Uncharacterized protein n=1 Tax=Colletotrichum tofieldiae TaxID=708197 RepID=A0A166YTP7_9PEZI|nr:hypothetical protein CT0861_12270 [Colletotrichum tofieldiae]
MPPSIVSLALPPVKVLTARTKTARAPIGASPADSSRCGRVAAPHGEISRVLLKILSVLLIGTTAR